MDNSKIWKIIDSHFQDNPQSLVRHHLDSYNDFYSTNIQRIFKEKNPITISSMFDTKTNEFQSKCVIYFGGKDGSKIYFGKPVIYDENNAHYMFPNEARLRNMTYGMTIHYDVEIEFIDILQPGELPTLLGGEELDDTEETTFANYKETGNLTGGAPQPDPKKRRIKKRDINATPAMAALIREATEKSMIAPNTQSQTITLEKIYLGKFPIMLQSDFCVLNNLPRETRHTMGECYNDVGGYFIIDGKEKTIVPQEAFANNILYVHKVKEEFLCSAEIRSVSENVSKPVRTFSVKLVAQSAKLSNENIVVNIPNVRKPVPLFIVFRALGFLSDKSIIRMCLLDLNKYESMIDLFRPSVHDAGSILTQDTALKYIASLTKGKTISHALEILTDYFLPHIGETNYTQKAYYLGYMVFKLLSMHIGLDQPADRDHFKFKRIELVGSLLYDLFREYYTIQQRQIHLAFEERLYYNQGMYEANLRGLIEQNYKEVFAERGVEVGFKKAFKGNWGAQTHTKRIGVIQDLNRLSFNSALSHLRKTSLQIDSGSKVVGPRLLHNSQWGLFDPIDTPDGGNIGIHKHLAICTYITRSSSREPMIEWMREKITMKPIEEMTPEVLASMTKIIINGYWAGAVDEPIEALQKIKLYRRNALLPIFMSASFDIKSNVIFIYTDGGRLCRPVFYRDDSLDVSYKMSEIDWNDLRWEDLISGFNKKRAGFDPNKSNIYELNELYEGVTTKNPAELDRFLTKKAILDYVDASESENLFISLDVEQFQTQPHLGHTHCEIHHSLLFGLMCNQICFPENNPATRNAFSCGQTKQACSLYSTNYQVRMDKSAIVLNYGQIPLVKTRYLDYVNREENTYGENAIVAIMCYTGYNVEDAILINEGALKRGLFRTTYYTTYEAHEEKSKNGDTVTDIRFTNIESENVVGTKPGYDYSKLDKYGIILENTEVDDKTVLIGLTASGEKTRRDSSKTPKKGQLGTVDKTFITDGEEGHRIAKVRVREQRIPAIGDKMASRAGQKGTVGLVIPECDMPFTKDGLRPDLIINPHAIPSRMTIGHLVESFFGKSSVIFGAFTDGTAFNNKGSKIGIYAELLSKSGYHSSGNEILYNGMTGEQIETEIFLGPTYYMRLKHMVKDKINYRALGPRTALTKQPVSGRANDGGLRIGEMERDSIVSHGASNFLRESMMERGDKYYIAVCNQTGMFSIYNPAKNIFISPMADGPIKFNDSVDGLHIENVTRFGRSFSVICVPYCLKLLLQELQTMNIMLRIVTEDNIKQIENMSYSDNIQKIMFDATPQKIVEKIKDTLAKTEKANQTPEYESPEYESPEYESQHSIPYTDELPYNPTDAELNAIQGSPLRLLSSSLSPSLSSSLSSSLSPAFSPRSPDELPYEPTDEELNAIKGSPLFIPDELPDEFNDIKESPTIEIGNVMHLRGDFKPTRAWIVKSIGDKFITIETEDSTGLDDLIKVVIPSDLYDIHNVPITAYSATPLNANLGMGGMGMGGMGMGGMGMGGMGEMEMGGMGEMGMRGMGQPSFVFAPTINAVGGNQSKVESDAIPLQVGVQGGSQGGVQGGSRGIVSETHDLDFKKPLIIKKMN